MYRKAILLIALLFVWNFIFSQNNLQESINKNRKGIIIIKGKPGAEIHVQQQKHEFWFGCALASQVFQENSRTKEADKEIYKKKFLELFNAAVTENAVKWGSMEKRRGEIDYQTPENILAFCEANNIPCRGHNLYWGINKFVQPWVKELNNEALREALKTRGVETAKRFKGRFFEYDLNNEMIHGNYYAEKLGEGITKDMANWVLKGDKSARLWLNDYDILTGNRLNDFVQHVKDVKKMDVPVSGLGVQGHLHGNSFKHEALQKSLDELAQFGLPIRITEFNLPGQRSEFMGKRNLELTEEEELQKAKDIVDYYTICFAHPAVEGILQWGFWAGANWIPQSSLYKKDWTPTPALEAYKKLIFETWWTDETVKLDENGEAKISAFFGDYKISSKNRTHELFHAKENKVSKIKIR